MESKQLTELAYDIQSGLGCLDIPDFDEMRIMGMTATLSVHIRGLGEIKYEVLRKVSSHYFNIPSYSLEKVIGILAEIEYVDVTKKGRSIHSIIPNVPRFQDIYERVGDYFSFSDLNEHEQATLLILAELQNKPENIDKLRHSTGIDNDVLTRCLKIGESGKYVKEFRARGKTIIASPFYFADNLESLVDTTAKVGANDIKSILEIVKQNQGWPLSIIKNQLELGGYSLDKSQQNLLLHLCSEGVLKPPSIKFNQTQETFVFTPSPGNSRLNFANREIYERAMALVSCVRKGQLLADTFKIYAPVRLLECLRDRGYLGSNSEAKNQYRNLVLLKVGRLKQTASDLFQFHLIQTEENRKALDIAINLLNTGELANLEVDGDARLALSEDEQYIQSIISSSELKQREQVSLDEKSKQQFEQLLLDLDL